MSEGKFVGPRDGVRYLVLEQERAFIVRQDIRARLRFRVSQVAGA
mgnify:CR=1 FL=1